LSYFDGIVSKLDMDDLILLNTLYSNDCVTKLQSMTKEELTNKGELSDFTFRKVSTRLDMWDFIITVKDSKKFRYYLTQHGLSAIHSITERIEA
jgi:hypothetical protein